MATYMYIYISIYLYLYLSISLSLYTYIYIYIWLYDRDGRGQMGYDYIIFSIIINIVIRISSIIVTTLITSITSITIMILIFLGLGLLVKDEWGQHWWGRCKSNEFRQIGEKDTPWHFWEDKSRLTGVPKRSLCQNTYNLQWPH